MLEHHLAEHLAVGARPWVGASHEDSQAAAQSAVWGAGDFQRTTRTYDTRVQSKIHSLANLAAARATCRLAAAVWGDSNEHALKNHRRL